jgi:hypothetical protein
MLSALLMREGIIWLIGEFSHPQDAVVQESRNRAEGMNGSSEMSTVVYERICTTGLFLGTKLQSSGSSFFTNVSVNGRVIFVTRHGGTFLVPVLERNHAHFISDRRVEH